MYNEEKESIIDSVVRAKVEKPKNKLHNSIKERNKMSANQDVKAQDFKIMKSMDQKYGDRGQGMKAVIKKKEKNPRNFNRMSVTDILAMNDDYEEDENAYVEA